MKCLEWKKELCRWQKKHITFIPSKCIMGWSSYYHIQTTKYTYIILNCCVLFRVFFNTKTIFCIVYICIYLQHVSFEHVLTIILHVRSCLKSYLFYTNILWLCCVLEIIKMANIIDFISTDQIICRILILEI